jgi:hypothetical protein
MHGFENTLFVFSGFCTVKFTKKKNEEKYEEREKY